MAMEFDSVYLPSSLQLQGSATDIQFSGLPPGEPLSVHS